MTIQLGFVVTLMLLMTVTALGSGGQGEVKVGYVFTDEEGNLGVNQETYNTYEGPAVSLNNFNYLTDAGFSIGADLTNITLNNRNLRFSAGKSGLFQVTAINNQYRRTYDFEGTQFTRRSYSAVQAHFTPIRHLKVFGGFNYTDKHGKNYEIVGPVADTFTYRTDYEHTVYNVGAQGFCPYGNLRLEFRRFDFFDDVDFTRDRKADAFDLNFFSNIPKYHWITLAAGYHHRLDKMYDYTVDLKTNQVWGATKIYLPQKLVFDYRLLYGKTTQTAANVLTKNWVHTVTVGKAWARKGGLRVGYESRLADNDIDRTESDGFLGSAWYQVSRLRFKGQFATRSKEVTTGSTLVGDEDYSRYLLSALYTSDKWGNMGVRYESRVRKNDDINSIVDYSVLCTQLNLVEKNYGQLSFSYSYYLGKYENRSDMLSYEFADNVLTAEIMPNHYRGWDLSLGATYYRSHRDQDIEKFAFNAGLSYEFLAGHHIEGKYNVFSYDDFLVRDNYYTGNIVEINIIKDLKL